MATIIDTMLEYLWVIDFSILLIFSALALKQRKNSSSLMTMAFVIIISGIIIKYQNLVNSFVDPDSSQTVLMLWCIGFVIFDFAIGLVFFGLYKTFNRQLKPRLRQFSMVLAVTVIVIVMYAQYATLFIGGEGLSYSVWCITAFYLGVALIDGFAIYVIGKLHQFSNRPHSLIARMYILAFSVAAIMQVLRFNEKYLWESNVFQNAYQLGLAAINISTSLVAMLIACLAIYHTYSKKKREDWLWKF